MGLTPDGDWYNIIDDEIYKCELRIDIFKEFIEDILEMMHSELKEQNYDQVKVHRYFRMCKDEIKAIKKLQKEHENLLNVIKLYRKC